MKQKIFVVCLILTMSFLFSSCKSNTNLKMENSNIEAENNEEIIVIDDKKIDSEKEGTLNLSSSDNKDNVDKENNNIENNLSQKLEQKDEKSDMQNGVYSKLLGKYVDKDKIFTRPVAIMIDNQYYARPQSSLSEADIVYEILAEGLITRYMAIFYSSSAEFVGPIRSARPYFINRALEYDALYAHVGGSPQAWADLVNLNVADLDGLSGNGMYRTTKTNKKAPHNTYSSTKALIKSAKNRGYRINGNFEFFDFLNSDEKLFNSKDANYIKIIYKPSSSSDKVGYYVEFKYDNEKKHYLRYVNGKKHIDEYTKKDIKAKNIIVQYMSHKVIDDKGRLKLGDIGTGKGYLITNGKKVNVTWEKKDRRSRTNFYDENGELIKLNSGNT